MCPDCIRRQAAMEEMYAVMEKLRQDFLRQRVWLEDQATTLRESVGVAPEAWLTAGQAAACLQRSPQLFRYEWAKYHRESVRSIVRQHKRYYLREDVEAWANSA